MDLLEAAKVAIREATEAGAGAADALAVERRETGLTVRKGELETSREAETRGVGVRAFRDGRLGIAYTTDLSAGGLRRAGRQAADLAALSGEDPAAGLPDPAHRAEPGEVPDLDDPAFDGFDPAAAVETARACEAAAYAEDPRVSNSEGSSFHAVRSRVVLAASDGFEGSWRKTRYGLDAAVVAEGEDGILQRDGWWTASTIRERLEDPDTVGRTAARRCVRRLGWRKVETRAVPVVLAPEVAASLAAHVARACSGDALYRRASFLADALGEAVASPLVTLVDDPTLPGGLGSRPFDVEGARVGRKAILEKGVLRNFLFDSYSLRKIGPDHAAARAGAVPGNAARGLSGSTTVGTSNLHFAAGDLDPEEVLAGVEDGFYVTETMGFGVNVITGDFSQGAAGLWIRDGRLDHPVQEVTIAGDLRSMLEGVDAVGNDLVFRADGAAPTMRIRRMTVSGS